MIRAALALTAALVAAPVLSHDVYTSLHGKNGQWCCNGDANGVKGDCAPALAKARGDGYDFLVRGKDWVHVPNSRITFLPVPGEETQQLPPAPDNMRWGHFCGKKVTAAYTPLNPDNVMDGYLFFCAFLDPDSM